MEYIEQLGDLLHEKLVVKDVDNLRLCDSYREMQKRSRGKS